MSSRPQTSLRIWALPVALAPAFLIRCGGTEADNPVTDGVVTACKADDEYDPEQVNVFLNRTGEAQTAAAGASSVPKELAPPGQPLTPTGAFPPGLSCVEWQLTGNRLEVQVINLRSGCSIEWEAGARFESGLVTLALENPACSYAACGNCLYDAATAIDLPAITDIEFELSEDAACNGQPTVERWQLPLTEEPRGMICGYASMPGLGQDVGHLFMDCISLDVLELLGARESCDAGLTCVGDEPYGRCRPACTMDADCPFPDGTRCDAGFCAPTVSRQYF
jgi:hypothetical protein